MKSIEIDRTKQLRDEPDKGHSQFQPDLPAILEVDEGDVSSSTRVMALMDSSVPQL